MYNLIPVLTAFRNVELPLLLTRSRPAERRRHVETALGVVGLADRMHHYPRQLSGGQEQRVAIARAIVADPTFLLCDEPTGDLDRKSADEILDLLERLVREHGKTVLMVTHDPRAAERARRRAPPGQGRARGGRERRSAPVKYLPPARSPTFARKKVRTAPHRRLVRGGAVPVRVLAVVRGAFQPGRWTWPAPTGWWSSTRSRSSSRCPSPTATRSCASPGSRGDLRQLVRRRVPGREEFLPPVRHRHGALPHAVPEFLIPDEQWKAFLADRQGCVVGEATAERFGWKMGDRIPIKGTIFPGRLGVQRPRPSTAATRPRTTPRSSGSTGTTWTSEGPFWKGLVGWYTVRIANPDDAVRVAKAIDERFANSPFETHTQTEKAFAASFVKQMGNIEFLILRIGERGVLHAAAGHRQHHGHRRARAHGRAGGAEGGRLLGRLRAGPGPAETVLVALAGGGLGRRPGEALHAAAATRRAACSRSSTSRPKRIAAGVGLALAVGLAGRVLPALSAMRLRVVDALRRV